MFLSNVLVGYLFYGWIVNKLNIYAVYMAVLAANH